MKQHNIQFYTAIELFNAFYVWRPFCALALLVPIGILVKLELSEPTDLYCGNKRNRSSESLLGKTQQSYV